MIVKRDGKLNERILARVEVRDAEENLITLLRFSITE